MFTFITEGKYPLMGTLIVQVFSPNTTCKRKIWHRHDKLSKSRTHKVCFVPRFDGFSCGVLGRMSDLKTNWKEGCYHGKHWKLKKKHTLFLFKDQFPPYSGCLKSLMTSVSKLTFFGFFLTLVVCGLDVVNQVCAGEKEGSKEKEQAENAGCLSHQRSCWFWEDLRYKWPVSPDFVFSVDLE